VGSAKYFDVLHEHRKIKRITRKRFVFGIVKVKQLRRLSQMRDLAFYVEKLGKILRLVWLMARWD